MTQKKPFNPFYAAVVAVGIAFGLTACAYGVMTVRLLDPRSVQDDGLVGFMERYGLAILIAELVVLAVLTFAAIGSDDYWNRRAEAGSKPAEEDRSIV